MAGLPSRALDTAQREGRFEAEGWRVRKDGTRFWASVVIDPIRDPAGELLGFAKITRDLTERRQAAQALEQAREAIFQSQKMDAALRSAGKKVEFVKYDGLDHQLDDSNARADMLNRIGAALDAAIGH